MFVRKYCIQLLSLIFHLRRHNNQFYSFFEKKSKLFQNISRFFEIFKNFRDFRDFSDFLIFQKFQFFQPNKLNNMRACAHGPKNEGKGICGICLCICKYILNNIELFYIQLVKSKFRMLIAQYTFQPSWTHTCTYLM